MKKLFATLVMLLMPMSYCIAQESEEIIIIDYNGQYRENFMKHFGMIGYNVSWGFEKKYVEARILVNDLNASSKSDFDFNDLVFDAKFTNNGARITVRAVGNTSPIRVGGKEAHELFGVSTSTMINTNDLSMEPITFDLEGDFGGDYNKIEVEMQDNSGKWYNLYSLRGDVPCKLAVPTTVNWCMENEAISDIYPDFTKYLLGNDCNWWDNYKGSQGSEDKFSGTCGENLTWKYDEATKTLTISGTGEMENYNWNDSPWYEFRDRIQEVILESGVTSIGVFAFSGCALTSVIIPQSLTIIRGQAFESCYGLNSVSITDLSAWCNIVFEGGHDDELGDFKRTDFIESNPLVFAKHLYLNGEEVKELVIPDNTTSINNYTFINCSSITSLTIPESVKSIGVGAFWYCTELSNVYCYAENVPQTDFHSIVKSSIDRATLHVPANSVDAYKSTVPWSNFKEIVALEGKGTDDDKTQLVGKWEFLWVTPYKSYRMTHVELKSDGTFSYTSTDKPDYEEHGTYKIEGDILYQMFSDEDDWELSRIKSVDSSFLTLTDLSDDGSSELRELFFHRENSAENDASLIGTWEGCYVNKERNYFEQWIFNTDGTGTMTEWRDDKEKKTEKFTYTLSGSSINVDWGDGSPEIYDYSISGLTLTLSRFDMSWKYYKRGESTGIRSVKSDNEIVDIYSLRGEKLNNLSKGINIIRSKDGQTKKVFVK